MALYDFIAKFGTSGDTNGLFNNPTDMCVASNFI